MTAITTEEFDKIIADMAAREFEEFLGGADPVAKRATILLLREIRKRVISDRATFSTKLKNVG